MNPHAQAFREWFGGEPAPYRVLVELYRANGGHLSTRQLGAAVGATPDAVRVSVQRLRAAMDPGSIRTAEGGGYWLTTVGLADCDRALMDVATRERSA